MSPANPWNARIADPLFVDSGKPADFTVAAAGTASPGRARAVAD
jgi:hypothetical protein